MRRVTVRYYVYFDFVVRKRSTRAHTSDAHCKRASAVSPTWHLSSALLYRDSLGIYVKSPEKRVGGARRGASSATGVFLRCTGVQSASGGQSGGRRACVLACLPACVGACVRACVSRFVFVSRCPSARTTDEEKNLSSLSLGAPSVLSGRPPHAGKRRGERNGACECSNNVVEKSWRETAGKARATRARACAWSPSRGALNNDSAEAQSHRL